MTEKKLYNEAVRREFIALGEWVKERAYDPSANPEELLVVLRDRLAALMADLKRREVA
jgi:hypothetical protein